MTKELAPTPADSRCPDCHKTGKAPYNWPTGRYFRCTTPGCSAIAYFVRPAR